MAIIDFHAPQENSRFDGNIIKWKLFIAAPNKLFHPEKVFL